MKISREIKLGALFVFTLMLFIWGINFLKGKDVFSRQVVFYAVYDDIGGLLETNPVSVSGVNIGQVDRIAFHHDGSGRVVVRALINRQIKIPVNSEVSIAATDIFGFKGLQITLGDANRYINSGDTLTGFLKPSVGEVFTGEFDNIKDRAAEIVAKVDSALSGIASVLSAANIEKIDHSLNNFQKSTASLQKTTHRVDQSMEQELHRLSNIMASVESITGNLEKHNETIDQIINNIADLSDILVAGELLSAIENADAAMASFRGILEKIEQGEGTAGMLVNDDTLYNKLTGSSLQLELLLEDIRKNPGKYFRISVFGR